MIWPQKQRQLEAEALSIDIEDHFRHVLQAASVLSHVPLAMMMFLVCCSLALSHLFLSRSNCRSRIAVTVRLRVLVWSLIMVPMTTSSRSSYAEIHC